MTVDLPEPLAPTRATTSPGRDVQVEAVEHRLAAGVAEPHVLEARRRPGPAGAPSASAGVDHLGLASRMSRIRSPPARACCPTANSPASIRTGATSCTR